MFLWRVYRRVEGLKEGRLLKDPALQFVVVASSWKPELAFAQCRRSTAQALCDVVAVWERLVNGELSQCDCWIKCAASGI